MCRFVDHKVTVRVLVLNTKHTTLVFDVLVRSSTVWQHVRTVQAHLPRDTVPRQEQHFKITLTAEILQIKYIVRRMAT